MSVVKISSYLDDVVGKLEDTLVRGIDDYVIAAGLLVKQDDMTMAYRPVLRRIPHGEQFEFVVHDQMFSDMQNYSQWHFHNGDYCGDSLPLAIKRFGERCLKQAQYCSHFEPII